MKSVLIQELVKIKVTKEGLKTITEGLVKQAREAGHDWDEIGAALGMGGGQAYVEFAHLIRESCGNCWHCTRIQAQTSWGTMSSRMILCEICGNKRCPHATNHELDCTGSNEPGQEGSVYA